MCVLGAGGNEGLFDFVGQTSRFLKVTCALYTLRPEAATPPCTCGFQVIYLLRGEGMPHEGVDGQCLVRGRWGEGLTWGTEGQGVAQGRWGEGVAQDRKTGKGLAQEGEDGVRAWNGGHVQEPSMGEMGQGTGTGGDR